MRLQEKRQRKRRRAIYQAELATRVLDDLRGRVDELGESFNREVGNEKTGRENMKKNRSE